jgi:hypothetical protein
MIPHKNHEPGDWNANWKGRMEWTFKLFKEGMFEHCITDCRTMLLYERLPPEYRIYCRTLIAACVKDWDEAEVRQSLCPGCGFVESTRW